MEKTNEIKTLKEGDFRKAEFPKVEFEIGDTVSHGDDERRFVVGGHLIGFGNDGKLEWRYIIYPVGMIRPFPASSSQFMAGHRIKAIHAASEDKHASKTIASKS